MAVLGGPVQAGVSVPGVCYGHQLMASALGGVVDYHPEGSEVGQVAMLQRFEALTR